MGSKKDPNQRGSGAKKHRRNFRLPMGRDGKFRTTGSVTRYRSRHGIPEGRRKDVHARGDCPKHNVQD